MGKGHMAKGATGRKKPPAAAAKAPKAKGPQPGRIEKRKHAHGASNGKKRLVQKLQDEAPPKAAQKQKRKRAANATALGAVAGMRGSLEELIAESEARVQERVAQAEGSSKPTKKSMSSKRRQQLVVEESQHLQDVLSHPAFVANPFAALQEHLSNTVTNATEGGKKRVGQHDKKSK